MRVEPTMICHVLGHWGAGSATEDTFRSRTSRSFGGSSSFSLGGTSRDTAN